MLVRESPSVAPAVSVPVDDAAYRRDPYRVFESFRQLGPIVWNRAVGLFVLTDREEILRILQNPAQFSSRRDVDKHEHLADEARNVLAQGYSATSILVNDDAPTHTRLRALVNKAFTRASISALEPSIRAAVDALMGSLALRGEGDVVAAFATPLPLTVICTLMGVDTAEAPRLKRWSRSWAALTHNRSLAPDEQVRCARELLDWQRFTGDLVEKRRAAPRDDLLSRLIEAREEGVEPLTTPEIAVFSMGLLFAGHETTANLIANTLLNVLRHGLWDRLAAEPRLVPKAIEETLRFDPPVQGMIRRATDDVDVAGVTVPRGEQLFLSFAAGNRDPVRFPDPQRFDIDREEPLRHLGFGHGTHFCLGAELARLEARIALVALLSAMRAPHLAADVEYPPSLVHRGPAALMLRWTSHG